MKRYSALTLIKKAIFPEKSWAPVWVNSTAQSSYDYVIIGGGGHGLATAYYLAKNHSKDHSRKRIALIERGWIGGGNTGRNTTVIRSNYLYPESAALYDFSLKLYETLAKELNYNIMLSQRGVLSLLHDRHDMDTARRSLNAMHANGVDAEMITREEAFKLEPLLNRDTGSRYAISAGLLQRRGGVARHDAIAWGYARAASALGVEIIQNCAVTGFDIKNGAICGLTTSQGDISCGAVGIAVAGQSTNLANMAGFSLPIRSMTLQAAVTEPLKPTLNSVLMAVNGPGVYASQTDKGEIVFGGALDRYNSYTQRGSISVLQEVVAGLVASFPSLSRVKMMRQWAGTVDVTPDSSPIIDETPVKNLFINCGWGTGGFKAIPAGGWVFAHLLANGTAHQLAKPFGFNRFDSLKLIDEASASGIAH